LSLLDVDNCASPLVGGDAAAHANANPPSDPDDLLAELYCDSDQLADDTGWVAEAAAADAANDAFASGVAVGGIFDEQDEMFLAEVVAEGPDTLPAGPSVFCAEDDQFLAEVVAQGPDVPFHADALQPQAALVVRPHRGPEYADHFVQVLDFISTGTKLLQHGLKRTFKDHSVPVLLQHFYIWRSLDGDGGYELCCGLDDSAIEDFMKLQQFEILQHEMLQWQVGAADVSGCLHVHSPAPVLPVLGPAGLLSPSCPELLAAQELERLGWWQSPPESPRTTPHILPTEMDPDGKAYWHHRWLNKDSKHDTHLHMNPKLVLASENFVIPTCASAAVES